MFASISVEQDVPMEMRDGVVLRADIYRPGDRERHPAILMRTPYGKSNNLPPDLLSFVLAGYAVAIQDVRGRFASDGEWTRDNMFAVEGVDGYDSVEWIAAQSWCDASVGMMGGSYLAGLQWFAAIECPPHLKAIAPAMGGMRSIGVGMTPVRSGGAISLSVAINRLPLNGVDVLDRLEKQGHDVSAMRRSLEWAMANPDEVVNYLPLNHLPHLQFPPIRAIWDVSIHPVPEEALARRWRYDRVQVPCFHTCGWYDVMEYSQFESFVEMRRRGGSLLAREGQYILVGPWTHGPPVNSLGAINFGMAAIPRPTVAARQIDFFDKYLRERDIRIPHVTYFVMGLDQWQTAEDWPLPQTDWQRFYLHSQGDANTSEGNGALARVDPQEEPPDRFIYNPLRPVPSVGGRTIGGGLVAGPLDQSAVARRSDVLCYATPELEGEVEITGPLELHLFAATTARDTDFTAKLVDVFPDGRAFNLAEGIKRASGHKSDAHPEPVIAGRVNEYVITLGNTSRLFRRGHRIRIDVSSSNFPLFDRNMNTGNPIGEDADGAPALQTILHQSGYASYIDLPVIPHRERGLGDV